MPRLDRLRLPDHADLPFPDLRQAAVAVVVGPADELLFIRRADRVGDTWSGHMAFPGGRHEAVDLTLLDTARRETREEVGLDLADARVLGALPPLASPMSIKTPKVVVAPYLFRVEAWPPFTLSEEVASTHTFALDRFLAREGRGTFPYEWNGGTWELPCVRLDGTLIWGMTLRMLDDLLERVETA